jgi:Cdc6-like AAA superfamily ATPase
MGMKKSAAEPNIDQEFRAIDKTPTNNFLRDDDTYVPMVAYKYFNINPNETSAKDDRELKDIIETLRKENPKMTIGDVLSEVKKIERKLGEAPFGESRLSRTFNYISLRYKVKTANIENNKLLKAFGG